MNTTPSSSRLHIALYGCRNAGKSSLLNALVGQEVALVSSLAGTTTDVVRKAIEFHPLGPCLFIDTAGFDDDEAVIGELRVAKTEQTLADADMALVLLSEGNHSLEYAWMERLRKQKIPFVTVWSKSDLLAPDELIARLDEVEQQQGQRPIAVSVRSGQGIGELRQALIELVPEDFDARYITGSLVEEGDVVLLVMPQDAQAPKGRLILPQVQTLRELLDRRCSVMCCTTQCLAATLAALSSPPRLIITDSQVFDEVCRQKPSESLLTSFSVLLAAHKGDIDYFVEGARAIARLSPQSRVLIAEACAHAPLTEDIGRVKIPRMLRRRVGEGLTIDVVAGRDYPDDLSAYDLVIHCGACMFNRKLVLSRVEAARSAGVPMTNYGVTIAYLQGILEKIKW